jgi:hypothetical protein
MMADVLLCVGEPLARYRFHERAADGSTGALRKAWVSENRALLRASSRPAGLACFMELQLRSQSEKWTVAKVGSGSALSR